MFRKGTKKPRKVPKRKITEDKDKTRKREKWKNRKAMQEEKENVCKGKITNQEN